MGGETRQHAELKRAALFWAQAQGYRVALPEVRVPRSAFRADVAAYRAPVRSAVAGPEGARAGDAFCGTAALFECKQSRADFLGDAHPERASLKRLEQLVDRHRALERRVGAHYPSLRKGESLFPEYDGIAHEAVGHEGLGRLERAIRLLKSRAFGKTKFDRLVRYGCAHLYYVVTAPGVLERHELPAGWGWLEAECLTAPGDGGEPPRLALRQKPQLHSPSADAVLALLHRLALAGTAHSNRAHGVDPRGIEGC